MTYGLLKSVSNDPEEPQSQIDRLEDLQRAIQAELSIVGSTGGAVVFRCNVCALPVHPVNAYHTNLAILCPNCVGKLSL